MAIFQDTWRSGGTGIGAYTLTPQTVDQIPLTIDLLAGQTANGFRVRNSAGTVLFSIEPDGDINISGNINAVINETLTGNVSLTGNLTVDGNTTLGNALTDTITINGVTTMAGALTVTGAGRFLGNLTVDNALTVSGETTLFGPVVLGGTLRIASGTAAAPAYSFTVDTDTGIYRAAENQIGFSVGGIVELTLDATNLSPGANDGNALGVSGTAWADLFLASGAIIDFAAGDITVTHAANLLNISGGDVGIGQNPSYKFHILSDANDSTDGMAVTSLDGVSTMIMWPGTSAANKFGSLTAHDTIIVTNNIERIYIQNSTSNIRIGTSATSLTGGRLTVGQTATGNASVLGVENYVAAAANSGAAINFRANRTTSGITTVSQIIGTITDITDATYAGNLEFYTATGGTLALELELNSTNLQPGANDGLALGVSGTAFSDLFLASGAIIDFNAADITLTHAANLLTFAGGNFAMGNDALILRDVDVGLTASTTQTQAGALGLTAEYNEVSTVANGNDAVRLPSAIAGMTVIIINRAAANTLQVFPASGDRINSVAIDGSRTISFGQMGVFRAIDATTWIMVNFTLTSSA